MTLEESRRKSGRDMEHSRQQYGRNMEEARRASGRKMREDMNALAESNRLQRTLPELNKKGPMPAARGRAVWAPKAGGGGGGIASPLTEVPSSRELHEAQTVLPADGYFFYSIKAVKSMQFLDADGALVIINLEAPADG